MKSLPQWSAIFVSAAPLGAWGLGLGDIELQSALNQPLEAEIALTSATAEELEGLRVGLAGADTYERYGLDRPFELTSLQFEVTRNGAGRNVIRVTSAQPIVDPFLTMLVEVAWPRGRSLREYTVLLDPPLFNPSIGAEPPIRQAATSAPQPSVAGGAIARAPTAPSAPATAPAASAPRPAAAAAAAAATGAGGSYGPVERSETLWSIASSLRPNDVTVNQMMVALYEANPSAFDGNMNMLRRGATLTVPERDRLLATPSAAATAEVRRHELSWQSPGGESVADAGDAPAAAGGVGAAAAAAAADAEQAQARLRLVPAVSGANEAGAAEAPAGGATSGTGSSGADEAAASAEVARLRSEVESLRGELDENRRLLELRNEELLALQAQLAAAGDATAAAPTVAAADARPAATPGVDLESEQLFADEEPPVATTEPEQAVETEAESAPAPAVVTPPASTRVAATTSAAQPSLLSRVLGFVSNPLLLIGLGIGAVLLTAVWYLRHRRDDVDDVTGRWDALEAEVEQEQAAREDTARLKRDDSLFTDEPRTEEFEAHEVGAASTAQRVAPDLDIEDTLSSQTVINLDQADSLAEADFHMAYGLYDQAAELVLKALESEPERRDLKLKLLEVYFVWGNKDAFLDAARDLHAEIGGSADRDWDKVLIMGKQICPDESLFAEAAAGGAVDLDLQGDGSTSLDFAFEDKDGASGSGESDGAADFGSFTGTGLDFDLAATGERIGSDDAFGALDGDGDADDDVRHTESHAFDDSLDIGAQTAAGLEAALFMNEDDDDDAPAHGGQGSGQSGAAADDDETRLASAWDDDEDAELALAGDGDLDGLAATQESPTVERPAADDDWDAFSFDGATAEQPSGFDAPTVETPTVEAAGPDAPTVETPRPDAPTVETFGLDAPTVETYGPDAPTVETPGPDAPTVETPTIETSYAGTERLQMPSDSSTAEQAGIGHADHTEEIDLDDLGLNLEDLPAEVGEMLNADDGDTREQPILSEADDLLSASGVTEVLSGDEALEQIGDDDIEHMNTEVLPDRDALSLDDEALSGTEVLTERHTTDSTGSTSLLRALDGFSNGSANGRGGDATSGNGLDLDLEDLAAALEGDTVDQPRSVFEADVFEGNGHTPVDLDIGLDVAGSDDPTGTEDIGPLDPQTMTEIGTKLDLARAYIDMGDPEGARSILEEVLDEGDSGQRREAQGLIDVLSA